VAKANTLDTQPARRVAKPKHETHSVFS